MNNLSIFLVIVSALISLSLASPKAAAQMLSSEEDSSLYDMDLEDLLKVSIASREPVRLDRAPGIVSVITSDRIKNSGARNLIDLLTMVPGFQFVSDYNGTLTLGVRGLLALEGKVLFMVDGIEQNDIFYNSVLLSYAYPVEQISRIEVIRGPGSVMYGGTAEYAVINVITLSGAELNGAQVNLQSGVMQDGLTRNTLSAAYGKKYGDQADDFQWNLKLFAAQAGISDRDVVYPEGSVFSAKDYKQNIQALNASAKYKGLTAKVMLDETSSKTRDGYGVPLLETTRVDYKYYGAELSYLLNFSKRITVEPTYTFRHTEVYQNDDTSLGTVDGGDAFTEFHVDEEFERHKIFVPAKIEFNKKLRLLAGIEYFNDRGKSPDNIFFREYRNPTLTYKSWTFETISGFAEVTFDSSIGSFSGGGRYESRTHFNDNFVPRFSWIKSLEKLNFKALYSEAYRNPSIGNLNYTHMAGTTVGPEKARVIELATSYNLNKETSATFNLFEIISQDTIVYDPVTYGYYNGERTGSRGAELEVEKKGPWGFSKLGVSYSDTSENKVANYEVPMDSTQTAGFSNLTVNLDTRFNLTQKLSLRPSLVYLGKRYGFSGDADGDGSLGLTRYSPNFVTNLNVTYEDLFTEGLDFNLGVFNVFNERTQLLTAYDLGRNTLPGPSREFLVGINYSFLNF